jgi:hypothetical protein
MQIDLNNTRLLGIGETVLPTDFCFIDGDFMIVDCPEVGHIIDGDEMYEYRRGLQGCPYEAMCAELGLISQQQKNSFRRICEEIQNLKNNE